MLLRRQLLLCFAACFSGTVALGQRLVLAGDNPDPTVIKVGKYYWASSTTSNWLPAFPLMKSLDLVHWKTEAFVFKKPPTWADYYFWAPELSYDKGKVFVYYAAHKKQGNLCIGVAQADRPEGPYTDLGPLECQKDGSIDAFPIRDEHGRLYLVWKEDGNSINQPTPIWASPMSEDRKSLTGEKKELFRNTVKWEGNLVEGVSIIKHGKYFYALYAASGCCGIACTYAIGVARAEHLLGPWEKYEKNPLVTNNINWVCPGHGTPIEKDGRYYFLHHAYDKRTIPFTGRQGILSEFKFTADNWVVFLKDASAHITQPVNTIKDHFLNDHLAAGWQWSIFQNINYKVNRSVLTLQALPAPGAYIGQKITSGNYEAVTELMPSGCTAAAGLAIIGDDDNLVAILYKNDRLQLVEMKSKQETVIVDKQLAVGKKLFLKVIATNAKNIVFLYSLDGKNYTPANDSAVDVGFLPPWDRAVRIGLLAQGAKDQVGVFKSFTLSDK